MPDDAAGAGVRGPESRERLVDVGSVTEETALDPGPRTPDSVLEAHGVRVRRPGGWELAVDHLALAAGEVLALLGPNGAGKSTLLHILALVERADTGEIRLAGSIVTSGSLAARRRLAVVLQQPLLLSGDVRANVALGLRLHGVARGERERRTNLWLERTGIAHLARRRARSLSGGEQRRVSLARALALDPLVLFLDEPFAALDTPTRQALLRDLPGWLRAAGCAAVLVTHDRDEALHLADRMAVLFDGKVRQLGPVDEVLTRPADTAVAAFLGVENILPGEALSADGMLGQVRVCEVLLEAAASGASGPVFVLIHPDAVQLRAGVGPVHESNGNVLAGRVLNVEPVGGAVRVTLDCGFPLAATISRSAAAELPLTPGAAVTATVKASAVQLIGRET